MSRHMGSAEEARAFLEHVSSTALVLASEREQAFAHTVVDQDEQIERLVQQLGDQEAWETLIADRDRLVRALAEDEQEIEELQREIQEQAERLQAVRSLCAESTGAGIDLSHRRIYEATRGNYS